jgi:hypothetical protein
VFRFANVSLFTQEDMNAPSDMGFDNVSLSPQEDMNSVFTSLDLDYHGDAVVTIQVCRIAPQTLRF